MIKKWWALYAVIGLLVFLGYSIRQDFIEQYLTYKIQNVYFTPNWECGNLGRISLVKFIVLKQNGNIWKVKLANEIYDLDISKSEMIFDANDKCINRLAKKE